MANTNPQFKQVLNMVNQGGNPKDIFYSMARERGVNPDEILNQLK